MFLSSNFIQYMLKFLPQIYILKIPKNSAVRNIKTKYTYVSHIEDYFTEKFIFKCLYRLGKCRKIFGFHEQVRSIAHSGMLFQECLSLVERYIGILSCRYGSHSSRPRRVFISHVLTSTSGSGVAQNL